MRDTIIEALRAPRRTDPCACAPHHRRPATRSARAWTSRRRPSRRPAKPGFDPRTTAEVAARRRPDVHPGAVGARQADGRGGQRRRGRSGRAPRARLRLRARPSDDTRFMWSFAVGPRRRTPAARTCCPGSSVCRAPRRWSCSAKACTGAEAVDLGLAYRCVDADGAARAAKPKRSRRGSPPDRRARSGCRSGCSTRASRPTSPHSLELEGTYQSLATTSTDLVEGHGRVPRAARRQVHRHLTDLHKVSGRRDVRRGR